MELGYRLFVVVSIILLNAVFSAAEASLLSVRQTRLKQLADEGDLGAQSAMSLLANPERFLSTVQLGLTLAALALGWIAEEPLAEWVESYVKPLLPEWAAGFGDALDVLGALVALLTIGFLHIVVGEVVPKNLAIEKADKLAVLLSPPLAVFSRVTGPFVGLIERSASGISRMLGLKGVSSGHAHTPDELRFIVSAANKQGHLDQFEAEAIARLLELRELNAREIMTPRNAIAGAPVESTLDELLRTFSENKYSRIPIYESSIEHVIGIVYAKDLLEVWHQRRMANERRRPVPQFDLRRILRTPPFVPETKPLVQLIDTFRNSRSHMAIVVDEFGSVTGLLTLEDVLEQIFGEIEDEHDVKLPPLPVVWSELDLEGTTSIRDLETHYMIDVPTDAGFETLAGFILFRLGRIPKEGDKVTEGPLTFTVMAMDRNRIVRVKVER